MPREERYPGLLVTPPGVDLRRSLGWQMVDWYETMLCHGPGDIEGEPLALDDELVRFTALAYSLNEQGRRLDALLHPRGRWRVLQHVFRHRWGANARAVREARRCRLFRGSDIQGHLADG